MLEAILRHTWPLNISDTGPARQMDQNCTIEVELDTSGLRCPLPLLKAKQALNKVAVGQCVKVVATDSGSMRDFKAFAELSGHSLLQCEQIEQHFHYILRKV